MNLIADTGIQFHKVPLDLNADVLKHKRHFSEEQRDGKLWLISALKWTAEDIFINREHLEAERMTSECDFDADGLQRHLVAPVDEELTYTLKGEKTLQYFENRWIPIPYFRKRFDKNRPYYDGPYRWCRGFLAPLENPKPGHTHDFVLAFDTGCLALDAGSTYDVLRPEDASPHGENVFGFVHDDRHLETMYGHGWFENWLTHEFERINPKFGNSEGRWMEPLAVYLVLLGLIKRGAPEQQLPDLKVFRQERNIEVSLVLDVGNSRTCGVLVPFSRVDETPLDVSKMRALELRNFLRPNEVVSDPFDMQLTFSEERFCDETLGDEPNLIGLGHKIFNWPSAVRLGEEAHQLAKQFTRQDGVASMSSPKRYLWDEAKSALAWRKVRKDRGLAPSDEYVNHGVTSCWDGRGRFLHQGVSMSESSHFCRSSLMSMALVEVLLQAISQMNSYEFRKEMGHEPYRRTLQHLVLTCPTAMPRTEQIKLREAADHAIKALRKHYPGQFWPETVEIVPAYGELRAMDELRHKEWSFDEATCSQVAFIYGELVHRMGGKAVDYFKLKGRDRAWAEGTSSTLRLASLDIGGGTSDMMICDYRNRPGFDSDVFPQVKPVFWEGFALAGDDIARSVIERILLPGIKAWLVANQAGSVQETLNTLFGPSMGSHTQEDKVMKQWFTQRVALPVAYGILQRRADELELGKIRMDELANLDLSEAPGMESYFEDKIQENTGVPNFRFSEITLDVQPRVVDGAIRIVMKNVLEQMSALISTFQCDMLLLTGRPSRLQAIRSMMEEWMPVSPDAIICMGDLTIGNWYPFADALECIRDPKTTVVVGAAIAHLCKHRKLNQFQLDAEFLKEVGSTAKYIGVLDQGNVGIDEDNLVVTPEVTEGEVMFSGSDVILGYRQLKSEKWIAAPLYRLGYLDDGKRLELERKGIELPYRILIEREEEDGLEQLRRSEVEDKNGESFAFTDYMSLQLHTMKDADGYWRDTGYFNLDLLNNQGS